MGGGACEPGDEAGQWLREELEESGKSKGLTAWRAGLWHLGLLETKDNETQGVGAMENICVQTPGLRKLKKIPDVFCKMGPLCLGWGGERGS